MSACVASAGASSCTPPERPAEALLDDAPAVAPREFDDALVGALPRGAHYLHGLFPADVLARLEERQWEIAPTASSNNMLCARAFFNDPSLAAELLSYLPGALGFSHVCSDLRFLRYPLGGFIAPHVDGVRCDEDNGRETTTSFLLYLETVPVNEGGETEFLTGLDDGDVVCAARPIAGSILIFPHGLPHQGSGVGKFPKVLLRGDLY